MVSSLANWAIGRFEKIFDSFYLKVFMENFEIFWHLTEYNKLVDARVRVPSVIPLGIPNSDRPWFR